MLFIDGQMTIPIDSRFVNAVAYIVFDVALVAAFGSILSRLQGAFTSRRLRNGMKVTLDQSPIGFLTGSILKDGSYIWLVLSVVQILVFIALFVATLGINGRTSEAIIPVQRDYIAYLPKDDPTIGNWRQSPPIFSKCVLYNHPKFYYQPTAFNVIGNSSIAKELLFQDQFGNAVRIDTNSSVCQDFEGVAPLLAVSRCGQSLPDCSNLNVSSGVLIRMKRNTGEQRTPMRSGYTKDFALWKKLEVPAGVLSSIDYSYLICSVRDPPRVLPKQTNYLCTAGHFDIEKQVYTFRIGRLNFSSESVKTIRNSSLDSTATFTPHSVEVELEYNVVQSQGMFFALILSQHSAKPHVAAREFLDSITDRLTAARRVGRDVIRQRVASDVTDVHLYTIGIYLVLTAVAATLAVGSKILRLRYGPSTGRVGRVNAELTTYSGVAAQLLSEGSQLSKKGVSFGVICDEEQQVYRLSTVHSDQKLSKLPAEAALQ